MTKSVNGVNTFLNSEFKFRTPGNYALTSISAGASPSSPSQDVLFAIPFFNTSLSTATSIAIHVTTASVAGTNVRLGIYNDNGALYPNGLIADFGTIATDSTGIKSIAINLLLGQNIMYWLVLLAESTLTMGSTGLQCAWNIANFKNTSFGTHGYSMYGYAFPYAALPTIYASGAATYIGMFRVLLKV